MTVAATAVLCLGAWVWLISAYGHGPWGLVLVLVLVTIVQRFSLITLSIRSDKKKA